MRRTHGGLVVRESVGAGRGLFALRNFDADVVVLKESPLASTSGAVDSRLASIDKAASRLNRLAMRIVASICVDGHIWIWRDVLRHLARPSGAVPIDQELLAEMHARVPESQLFCTERYAELYGVLNLNSFRTPSNESAIFDTGSMINHSCLPNLALADDAGNFISTRPIDTGEELSVAYVDPDSPKRNEYLEWNYGFLCKCPKCVDELQ